MGVSKQVAQSMRIIELQNAFREAKSTAERNNIWDSIEIPIIEEIPNDKNHKLVTYLYRLKNVDVKNQPLVYLYSAMSALAITEKHQLILIPNSDIWYASFVLHNKWLDRSVCAVVLHD
jgi:hypothetical protein